MVEPIEKTDPEFAQLLKNYLNSSKSLPILQTKKQCLKKIGRNDPCICGSGKKYKRCCLK